MKDSPAHLYRRFRYHVGPEPDPTAADRWAAEHLLGAELALFASMTVRDRVHSVAVARRVEEALTSESLCEAEPAVPAGEGWEVPAALLHDVGKALAPLGTTGRVVASLAEGTAAGDWLEQRVTGRAAAPRRRGPLNAMGAYLTYTELGAAKLEAIGSRREVSAWAREHHLPANEWTVPTAAGQLLAAADGSA